MLGAGKKVKRLRGEEVKPVGLSLFTVHCSLFTIHCSLFTAHIFHAILFPLHIKLPADRTISLLKNTHLLRCAHPSSLQRTVKYASFLLISRALHPDVFDQPARKLFFYNLLYFLYPDSAYLELGDFGHRVKRVDGQEVGCSFLEMKAHKHDPGRDLVGNLSFHLD